MARDPPSSLEDNAFVFPEKGFYATPIEISHWQLRHYISNPEPNILYYASKHTVFCLNAATSKCTHVATLPFPVRCFAAGHGYVCAGGGEAGDFAIIKLNPSWAAEVDALLPLNLGSSSPRQKDPVPEIKKFGSDIVNSVSIHKLKDPDSFFGDDVVAVITSNDQMVRILSLTQGSTETAVLKLPFPVNHATISPDGELLVAVGDFQQAFFYERTYCRPEQPRSLGGHASSLCSWELLANPMLHVPKSMMVTGYFTTAWSPSSRLCAVASECGYITIFETERLKDFEHGDDAIAAVLPGTRPEAQAGPGSIRTLMFSPAPWDLLAWAEDQGRVVVANLRDSCKGQQILKLDRGDANVKQIHFDPPVRRYVNFCGKVDFYARLAQISREMRDVNRRVDRHLQQLRESWGMTNNSIRVEDVNDDATRIASEYESMQRYLDQYEQSSAERRYLEEHLTDARREIEGPNGVDSNSYPSHLNARELEVLSSLRTTHQALDRDRDSSSTRPRSIQYRPSELSGRRSGLSRDDESFPALTRSRANGDSTHDNDDERIRAIREYIRRPIALNHYGPGSQRGDSSSERTLQTFRNLLYNTRRDSSLSLTNSEIEAMLDQASAIDAARRNANDPSITASSRIGSPSQASGGNRDSPASASARRRAQLERIHANNRATAMALRDAGASGSGSSARDAWTPHRTPTLPRYLEAYANMDTYIPFGSSSRSGNGGGNGSGSGSGSGSTAAAAAAAAESRAVDRAERARESLARQARLEINRAAGFLRREVPDPAYGVQTAGLAWSEDGRSLWVGCAEGIWEFGLDLKARMRLWAVEFR